ncbi:TatD family hydrolase [Ichthyobacterium seriolicida]|uniref:TatD family hydrolase n=1 Tax=Ichthyobacterium seriolicida TaxID=242600 RepID=A0A1J1DZS9_9FLAO|nr:TatD family hydrolase [Ichthyobacterium seriolicida]BAV95434.1 TatD family hydrolase [Ichthyobacterium seriolicida]
MYFIDTHSHLYLEQFDLDRDEIIDRSIKAGIHKIYLPSISGDYIDKMLSLENRYPNNCFAMIGLHPCYVKDDVDKELDIVRKWLLDRDFIAIGEIGMDKHWDTTYIKEQERAFIEQIRLAKEINKPIVIHCREAFDEIFKVLDKESDNRLKGVFHCFSGNLEQAQRVLSYGLKIGIGGIVTFKNGGLDKFLDKIPIENIVLETDSPYLAPNPYRGKRNETCYLIEIANKVASLYSLPIEEVMNITRENSEQLFQPNDNIK